MSEEKEFKGLRYYAYKCDDEECGEVCERLVRYDERHNPAPCQVCGFNTHMVPTSPMVLQATWPDGHRRQNDPNWQLLKERSKLQVQKANTYKRSEKKVIENEMNKLKGK